LLPLLWIVSPGCSSEIMVSLKPPSIQNSTAEKAAEMPPNSWPRKLEYALEQALFSSRWLLAPFFVGLALSIFILLIKFVKEMIHIAGIAVTATGTQLVAEVLSLVDLTLTASLLIIVVFSGYENFVSRIDHTRHRDWPEWMGSIDFTGLKLKLLSSIVAISAVQLLKQFMAVGTTSDRDLLWSTGIHLVFVVSSVLLALSDRIANHASAHKAGSEAEPNAGPDAAVKSETHT
jgi:uncharacterized protein (TIGR00645 family)